MRSWFVFFWFFSDVCLGGSLGIISSSDGRLTLAVTMDQAEDGIVHNRLTSLNVQVLPSIDGESHSDVPPLLGGLEMEVEMQDFKIGTILKPRVTEVAPLHYRIDGLLLHVPGIWRIQFYINLNDEVVTFAKAISTALPISD